MNNVKSQRFFKTPFLAVNFGPVIGIKIWSQFQVNFFFLVKKKYEKTVTLVIFTAWKVSVFGVFLDRIFPHSDWIRRDTEYLFIFSLNAGKYQPEKLRVRTLFTQCFAKAFKPQCGYTDGGYQKAWLRSPLEKSL